MTNTYPVIRTQFDMNGERTICGALLSNPTGVREPGEFHSPHSAPVTVVVAHRGLLRRNGLRRHMTLKEGLVVVPFDGSSTDLLQQCRKMAPSVLVIDERTLECMDPAEVSQAAEYGGGIRIVVVSARKDDETVLHYIRMGCMGVLGEGDPPCLLKKVVSAVVRGEYWGGRRMLAGLIQQLLRSLDSEKLTAREREVLGLIAQGMKNRAIAERLCITHETVRWHIRSLHAKLGHQDRRAFALYARTISGLADGRQAPLSPYVPCNAVRPSSKTQALQDPSPGTFNR